MGRLRTLAAITAILVAIGSGTMGDGLLTARPAGAATSTVLVSPNHSVPLTLSFGPTSDVRRVKFQALAGQLLDVTTLGGTFADNCAVTLTMTRPNGAAFVGATCVGVSGGPTGLVVPSSGVYQATFSGGTVAGSVQASVIAHGPGLAITPSAPALPVTVPARGSIDLQFNAPAGRAVAAVVGRVGPWCGAEASILAPDGTVEWGPSCVGIRSAQPPFAGQGVTTASGLHTLRITTLDPTTTVPWAPVVAVFAGTNPVTTTTIDAPAVTATVLPGQEHFVQFAGVAGESIGLRYGALANRCVELIRPDGSIVHQDCSSSANNAINDTKLDATGTWRVRLRATAENNRTIILSVVHTTDPTATTIDGRPLDFVFSSAGEVNHAEFAAQRGDPVAIVVSAGRLLCPLGVDCGCTVTACPKTIEVRDPSGSVVPGSTAVIDLTNPLPMVYLRPRITTAGTWSVWITSTSSTVARVQVVRAPDLTASVAPGATVAVDTDVPAQRSVISFPVVGGHRYAAIVTRGGPGAALAVDLDLTAIGAVQLHSTVMSGQTVFVGPLFAVTDGTGTLTSVAQYAEGMHLTVRIVDLAPVTTPVTLGVTSPVVTTLPHQIGRFTFTGTTGQKISVESLTNTHAGPVSVRFLRPDGTQLGASRTIAGATTFLDPVRLDATGTWTVEAISSVLPGGNLALRLTAVVDITATIVPDGAARSFVFTTPGQQARYTFGRTIGQPLRLRTVFSTLGTMNVRIIGPLGTTVQTCTISGTSTVCPLLSAPSSGTYTVVVDPPGTALGSATVSITTT